ncbi:MAG: hypothetical protein R3E90_06615 [Marinicella sp.]
MTLFVFFYQFANGFVGMKMMVNEPHGATGTTVVVPNSIITAPTDGVAGARDRTGHIVAVHGDKALVSSKNLVYAFEFDGSNWNMIQVIRPSMNDYPFTFGMGVSIYGNTAMIGQGVADNQSGRVYVFKYENNQWNQTQILYPNNNLEGNKGRFGAYGISIEGNRAVIGSQEGHGGALVSGYAYVFEFDGSQWNNTQILKNSDSAINDRFGHSVSLSGDRIMVGAYERNISDSATGKAYIFELHNGSWVETHGFRPAEANYYERFSYTVSLNNDTAIISRLGYFPIKPAAFVFRFDGENWNENQIITDWNGYDYSGFGLSISQFNNQTIISAAYKWDQGSPLPAIGSVYLFEDDDSQLNLVDEFQSPTSTTQSFGHSINMFENHMVIGIPQDTEYGIETGSAQFLTKEKNTWVHNKLFIPPKGANYWNLGTSMQVSGNRLIVGTGPADLENLEAGASYLYEFNGVNWQLAQEITPSDSAEDDFFGQNVSIDGDRMLIGVTSDITQSHVTSFEFNGTQWIETQKLSFPSPGLKNTPIDMKGNKAVVLFSESAHCFEHNGTSWVETQIIPGSWKNLSLNSDWLMLSDYKKNQVLVYQNNGGQWVNPLTLTPSVTNDIDSIGFSILIHENQAYVTGDRQNKTNMLFHFEHDGTWQEKATIETSFSDSRMVVAVNNNNQMILTNPSGVGYYSRPTGAAFLYEYNGTSWLEKQKLAPLVNAPINSFGSAIAITNDHLFISAPESDIKGTESGSVHIYDFTLDIIFKNGFD